jgi:cyclase
MRTLVVSAALVAAAAIAVTQQDFSQAEVKVIKVAGSVYMLETPGVGNIGVTVGDDGVLIVDDQDAQLVPKILDAVKSISDKPIKYVLNTHWHGDHTGGNELLGKTAPIIAHTNVRRRLGADGKPPAPKGALPVITFDDRLVVHINGEDVRAIHFPKGHTDGDAVVFFTKSNVVHMGDDFFAECFPFIDLASGGSVKGLIANVDKILEQLPADVKVIPGHGPVSTADDLRAYSAMLKKTSGIVEAGIAAGKSLEQLQKEKALAEFERLSWSFIPTERFLEILYNDLKKGR